MVPSIIAVTTMPPAVASAPDEFGYGSSTRFLTSPEPGSTTTPGWAIRRDGSAGGKDLSPVALLPVPALGSRRHRQNPATIFQDHAQRGGWRRTFCKGEFCGHFHKEDGNCRHLAGCRNVLRRLRSQRPVLPEHRPREWQRTGTGKHGQYWHWRARKRNCAPRPQRAGHRIKPRNQPSVAGATTGQTTWAEC
jgi:hypothetical protein